MFTGHSLATYTLQRYLEGTERFPVDGGSLKIVLVEVVPRQIVIFMIIMIVTMIMISLKNKRGNDDDTDISDTTQL